MFLQKKCTQVAFVEKAKLKTISTQNYKHKSPVLRIQLIFKRIRIRILDPHWKKMDPDPDPNPDPDPDTDPDPGYFLKIY